MQTQAAELVATAPEVILANGTSVLTALREATQSIPIVFVGISDPEGAGIVANLARPGGHMTGFTNFEPAIGGKWLQTLKEIAPHLTSVGVIRNPASLTRIWQSIEAEAVSMEIKAIDCGARDADGINTVIGAFRGQPNTGLIVLPDPILVAHRGLIIELAAKQRHPAVYPFRTYPDSGGLLSYGVNDRSTAALCLLY